METIGWFLAQLLWAAGALVTWLLMQLLWIVIWTVIVIIGWRFAVKRFTAVGG